MVTKQKTQMTRVLLLAFVLTALLGAGILAGCRGRSGQTPPAQDSGTESSQGESGGEHGGSEGSEGGESGGEGSEGSSAGSEEAAAAQLTPDETFDMVRSGAHLILNYDAATNHFKGTVTNTTNNTLTQVRIEVHLSNGTELGPTTPIDLAPGETAPVDLPSTAASFTSWVAHAEVGSGAEGQSGGEGAGEHGGAGGEGTEGSGGEGAETGGSTEINEAAMSSPTIPLDQTWQGNLGGLAVDASYDAATQSVVSVVQNTTANQLCYVQAEPHLKSGTQTVGELGPDVLGHLNPGQTATSSVSVSSEPSLAGVSFDGYVIHLEVFDCAGPGPVPHTGGEGAEGSGGEGPESGGSESGGEEASAAQLTPDQTFDMVRSGARLILNYDATSNSFTGTVENTTNNVLTRVRIEVHLSNGTELGPTTPMDLAPGQMAQVDLPSTTAPFTGWIAHAEVGSGAEGSSQSAGEGSGEHGGSGEGGGEHGSGGEGQGGG